MQTVILNSNSAEDLKLLTQIAKKMGIKVKFLTEDEKEEFGLLRAIKKGRTGKYIDTDNFIKKLRM